MLWIIARREFLDHFKSARFLIGLALAVSVTVGVVAIATDDYAQRLADYNAAPKALDIGWTHPKVFHRPSPFSILAARDEVRLGNRVDISYRRVPLRPVSYTGQEGQDAFSDPGTWRMDFAFVVQVILSLVVLFLMYDAVAGENERGTLPLVLSGSLGRTQFLTGKLIGGLISTLVVFALCALLATLVMLQSGAVALDAEDAIRLLAIFAAGYLCLVAYCAAGVLISSCFRRSSPALLVSILVWVVAVGLLPGLGIELGRFASPLPGWAEIDSEGREAARAVRKESSEAWGKVGGIRNARDRQEAALRAHDLSAKAAQLEWQVNREYLNRMLRQRRAALLPMMLSPSASLEVAAAALAGTDAHAVEHFMAFVRRYSEDYSQFRRQIRVDRTARPEDRMPVFQEQTEPVADAFARVGGFLLAPLMLFVGCFLSAQMVFLRYQVRRE